MELDSTTCYQAILTHDRRFDGVFFTGVASTGIYCRTVCTARKPRRENCSFYPSAAAAEKAGYRPCLRCRPELAPGAAPVDSSKRLARLALDRLDDLDGSALSAVADEVGVSDRHLRRVIRHECGVTPVELVQTRRLLLAKQLLTDTGLPISQVAFASGFSSVRRMNALFLDRYGLAPGQLRRAGGAVSPEAVECHLTYRPPFDWDRLASFLGARSCAGVESVDAGRYHRTVELGNYRGWIMVEPAFARHGLRVTISSSLIPKLAAVLARVKRLFDLGADPYPIALRLGPLASKHPGLRLPGAFNGFEVAVRAILGQQVSVRAATTLAGRLAARFGDPIETPFPALTHTAATAHRVAQVSASNLVELGITGARANALITLAKAVVEKSVQLKPTADVDGQITRLCELPGIGAWTAEYIAMRGLSWPDAFPASDLGVMKAMNVTRPRDAIAAAEPWRPWRSYAVMHLWQSLEERA